MARVLLREICDPEESQKSWSPLTTKYSKRAAELIAPSVLLLARGCIHSPYSELASGTALGFSFSTKSLNFTILLISDFCPTPTLQEGVDIISLLYNNEDIKVKWSAPDQALSDWLELGQECQAPPAMEVPKLAPEPWTHPSAISPKALLRLSTPETKALTLPGTKSCYHPELSMTLSFNNPPHSSLD